MADEKIVIKIDVDARTTAIERTTQAVKRLKREAGKFSSGRSDVTTYLNQMGTVATKNFGARRRHFDFFDRGVKMMGTGLKKFVTVSIKGLILEMALLGATMIGINALFATGNFLAKTYSGTMQILAGSAASAAVTIATAAAAIREQQAAMFAYRGKGAGEFGSGLNQATVAMRALQMDASLAGLGVENLNKAYAAMSKTMTTPQINASTNLFKSLMDFGAAGQDPSAAAEKVGAMIAALSDSKKSLSDVKAAATAIGPEMTEALKKANVKTKDQLKQLIMSGELAKLGGVAGQFDAVNQTLIGQMRGFFNLVRGQFADFGGQFLEPAKIAMQKIFRIISRDLKRMMGAVSEFGSGTMMDGLVSAVDKTSTWMVNLVEKWLPKAEGFFSRIGDWWEGFKYGWNQMVDSMRPFLEGAKVLEEAFSPVWQAIKDGTANFRLFNDLLQENKPEVLEFGERTAELVRSISDFSMKMKEAFFDILPLVNDVVKGIKEMFDLLAGGMTKFAGAGMFGSLFPIMAMFVGGKTMSQTKGGFLPKNLSTMNVNATNVTIASPGMGGPVAPGFAGPMAPAPGGQSLSAGRRMTYQESLSMTSRQRGGLGADAYMQQQNALINSQLPITSQAYHGGATATRRGLMDPAVGPLSPDYSPGRIAQARMKMRYDRSETRLGAAIFGNEKQGIKGINNSMTARMGVGMGMGMLSQYAPEEMSGALALGGTVGMFNPMAGLAVGLGGAALQSGGAGSGALAGAGGGAAIGMMVAGPAGAAVGAAIGLVGGAIMGNSNKLRRQAEASRGVISGAFDGLVNSIQSVAFSQIAENRKILEAGGSLEGKEAALGGGGRILKNKLAPLGKEAEDVLAMGKTNKTSYGRNALAGAGTGAMIGGYAGSGFGPAGIAVGAVIGGVVGASVTTAVSIGDWAIGKLTGDDKKARAQTALIQKIYDNQAAYGLEISKEQLETMKKDKEAALEEVGTKLKNIGDTYTKMDDIYKERTDLLSEMSGKSGAEIEVLAQQLGVNLYDSTKDFMEVARELGIALIRTTAEMKAANREALLAPTNMFETEIKALKAAETLDIKARTIKDQFAAGGLSEEATLQYASDMSADMLAFYKGDSIKAFFEMQKALGVGGTQYKEGGALEGMESVLAPLFARLQAEQKTLLVDQGIIGIQGQLAENDLTASNADLKALINSMDPAKQQQFLSMIESGSFTEVAGRMGGTEAYLKTLGFDPSKIKELDPLINEITGDLGPVADAMGIAATDFKTAVENFVEQGKDIFNPEGERPEWFTKAAFNEIMGIEDTYSPRGKGVGDTTSSRLEQTMGRHAAMNGQLTGTRNITSAFRTFGLGSPSSDHATGRAYDLTGQNLGAYSKLVHANGGFAEFHGNNANRHLHVVPGPGGMGDTTVPSFGKMSQSMPGQSGSSVTNNITVNGAPGQSPEAIAAAVIQKIDARERNIRERR
jgi:hypothetical protein